MFYAIIDFAAQLSLLYLLITTFVLTALLLGAVRARRLGEEQERREAARQMADAKRDRRPIGARPAIPARVLQPAASLAPVPIYREAAHSGMDHQALL